MRWSPPTPLIGVTMRHDRGVPTIQEAGEDHERDYDNWARFGKECVSRGVL